MALTGMVDKRTLEKYQHEAKERSRESWYLSWALDTNQEGTFVQYNNIHFLQVFFGLIYIVGAFNLQPFNLHFYVSSY